KQWGGAEASEVEDCVVAPVAGHPRDLLHPSRQADGYRQYLLDCHPAFSDGHGDGDSRAPIVLSACSYLHNWQHDPASPLLAPRFADLLAQVPLFAGDQADELITFLSERVGHGDSLGVLGRALDTRFRTSKRLLDHVAAVVRGEPAYVLLDEQQVVF